MNLYFESESSKCGEIFLLNNGNFIISCDFCSDKFNLQNVFTKHVLENHLSDDLSDFNDSKESIAFENIEDKDFIDTDVPLIQNKIHTEQIINQYGGIYSAEALYQANGSLNPKDGITLINENELIEVLDEYEDIFVDTNKNLIKSEILEDVKNENDDSITYNIQNNNTDTPIIANYQKTAELDNFPNHLQEKIYNTADISDQIEFFVCNHCGAKFAEKNDLNAHYIIHKAHNKCSFCNKTYTKMEALKMHELKHLNPYKCSFCEKTFFKKHMLQEHENIHLGIKPHKCEFCPATFTSRTNLKVHRNRHLNVRPYACSYCDKTFVATTERKMHERAHRGEKPAICDICGIGFINTQKLNEHKKRHTNTREFRCESCSKAFYSKHQLDQHKVCHMSERSFACGECNAKFKRKKNLLQHYRTHSIIKNYKCDICYQRFTQSSGLQAHMKKHKNIDEIPNNLHINEIKEEDIDDAMAEFDEGETLDSVDEFIGDVDQIITSSILIDEQTLINHIL